MCVCVLKAELGFVTDSNHWSEWQGDSLCPVTCGPGVVRRERKCYQVTIGGCPPDGNTYQEDYSVCSLGDCINRKAFFLAISRVCTVQYVYSLK